MLFLAGSAHTMLEHQALGFDATFVELRGLTITELEAKARDYALTQEE